MPPSGTPAVAAAASLTALVGRALIGLLRMALRGTIDLHRDRRAAPAERYRVAAVVIVDAVDTQVLKPATFMVAPTVQMPPIVFAVTVSEARPMPPGPVPSPGFMPWNVLPTMVVRGPALPPNATDIVGVG